MSNIFDMIDSIYEEFEKKIPVNELHLENLKMLFCNPEELQVFIKLIKNSNIAIRNEDDWWDFDKKASIIYDGKRDKIQSWICSGLEEIRKKEEHLIESLVKSLNVVMRSKRQIKLLVMECIFCGVLYHLKIPIFGDNVSDVCPFCKSYNYMKVINCITIKKEKKEVRVNE